MQTPLRAQPKQPKPHTQRKQFRTPKAIKSPNKDAMTRCESVDALAKSHLNPVLFSSVPFYCDIFSFLFICPLLFSSVPFYYDIFSFVLFSSLPFRSIMISFLFFCSLLFSSVHCRPVLSCSLPPCHEVSPSTVPDQAVFSPAHLNEASSYSSCRCNRIAISISLRS